MSDYTAKQKAMVMGPRISALLSIFGSSYIIYDVLRKNSEWKKEGGTHHRLLLGMSLMDVLVSFFGCFTATWFVPSDENVWGASGNQTTCNVQGFFAVLGIGVAVYNASLSVYYVGRIRWQVPSARLQKRWEPLLHGVPWLIGFTAAMVGLTQKQYNRYGWNCWLANKPYGCNESWKKNNGAPDCVRGDNASSYAWILFYGFLWASILTVTVSMFLVWRSVYSTEKKMQQYNFQYQQERNRLRRQQQQQQQQSGAQESNHDDDENSSQSSRSSSSNRSAASSIQGAVRSASSRAMKSIKHLPQKTAASIIHRSKKFRNQDHQRFKHSRKVARQGYWYCGAFYLTWFFPTLVTILRLLEVPGNYPLYLITAISIPLQGFSNFWVYIYPRLACCKSKSCGGGCLKSKSPSNNSNSNNAVTQSDFTLTFPKSSTDGMAQSGVTQDPPFLSSASTNAQVHNNNNKLAMLYK